MSRVIAQEAESVYLPSWGQEFALEQLHWVRKL